MTDTIKTRTLAELAKEVLLVQDACNLSGVAHGFARAMSDLGAHTVGTDERNTHPIAILWADKIASLAGIESPAFPQIGDAYTACRRLAEVV